MASVIRVHSEGLGLRATGRCFGVHKNTVSEWEYRFAKQKSPLMLYAICHSFIQLTFEGDELYTIVGKQGEACDSQGWTAVIMESVSRFIVEQRCGEKDTEGKRGRPPKTLPPQVKVRVKNKGSQASVKKKRPKYDALWREHPETQQDLSNQDIHANHIEAQNAALRRRNSAFRRRTNTYAKTPEGLQRTLDVHQLIHNFVRRH